MKYVIPESQAWCDHGDEEALFLDSVTQHWLPFVVTDSGLLAGILLSSCRAIALNGRQTQVNYDYSQIAMMYKVECIRSTNTAIAEERTSISETTIAKALMLCADEVSLLIFPKDRCRHVFSKSKLLCRFCAKI